MLANLKPEDFVEAAAAAGMFESIYWKDIALSRETELIQKDKVIEAARNQGLRIAAQTLTVLDGNRAALTKMKIPEFKEKGESLASKLTNTTGKKNILGCYNRGYNRCNIIYNFRGDCAMSLPLQQQKYIQQSTIKHIVTLIKAAEKDRRGSLPNCWSLGALHNFRLDKTLIERVNATILELQRFLPPEHAVEILKNVGWPEEEEKVKTVLRDYAKKEPLMAKACARLIYEIQLLLFNVGIYQFPPSIIDFEPSEEGDIAMDLLGPPTPAEDLTPPKQGGEG
jgi:hypothetical protein